MLQRAAETLRRLLPLRTLADVPHEFIFMSVAHLLEELSRSLAAGDRPSRHTVDAALEIARHIEHRHPRQDLPPGEAS